MTPTPISIPNKRIIDLCNNIAEVPAIPGLVGLKVTRILAALLDEARRIGNNLIEIQKDNALLDDEQSPRPLLDEKGKVVNGKYITDPTKMSSLTADENSLLNAETTFNLQLLSTKDVEEIFKKKDIPPLAGTALLFFELIPPPQS